MNFTHNFGGQPVQPRIVYQDTRDSSPLWRQDNRVFHPLTELQFANRFRQGDRVRMRLTYPNSKMFITPRIVTIASYNTAQQVLGSYNADNAFKGIPFTRVLVLDP
jgi:hypothetical protein